MQERTSLDRREEAVKDAIPTKSLIEALAGDPILAAQRLVGCELVFGDCRVRIVETEGYRGGDDPGSHAFRGETKRTAVMFGQVGLAYVYFVYGNHWMLNVTAHEEGSVGAVLIRAARPLEGIDLMRVRRSRGASMAERELLNGPGKLCQALGIDGTLTGVDLLATGSLVECLPVEDLLVGPRVGLAVGKGHEFPWRFISASDAAWASRPQIVGA